MKMVVRLGGQYAFLRKNKIVQPFTQVILPLSTEAKTDLKNSLQKRNLKMLFPVPPCYWNRTVDFMQNYFLPYEPLGKAYGICDASGQSDFANLCLESLRQNISMVCIDTDNDKISAAVINESSTYTDYTHDDPEHFDNSKLYKLIRTLNQLNREADAFKCFKVEVIFNIKCLAVHKDDRFLGLASRCFKRAEDEAYKLGYTVVKVESTNTFTSRICKRFGLMNLVEYDYDKLGKMSHNENVTFKVDPAHNSIIIYSKKLEDDQKKKKSKLSKLSEKLEKCNKKSF